MENSLDQFSDEELDLVTECLLNSAKTRFDYEAFKNELEPVEQDFIDYNILLEIITGKASGESNLLISAKILSKFLMLGYMTSKEDIIEMINQKETELGLEIMASRIAMDSLQNGVHPTLVIKQISILL
ncbi:hypothetical protein DI383_08385 [Flavobacteriaceae bacterium LYZ1037]|nr:hypothetical protein DI383_08385 [Flavobacteriaceae bacterium LYZ1037]